jgi:hypothetical protein
VQLDLPRPSVAEPLLWVALQQQQQRPSSGQTRSQTWSTPGQTLLLQSHYQAWAQLHLKKRLSRRQQTSHGSKPHNALNTSSLQWNSQPTKCELRTCSRLEMRSLHSWLTTCCPSSSSRNSTLQSRMRSKISWGVSALNGGAPAMYERKGSHSVLCEVGTRMQAPGACQRTTAVHLQSSKTRKTKQGADATCQLLTTPRCSPGCAQRSLGACQR